MHTKLYTFIVKIRVYAKFMIQLKKFTCTCNQKNKGFNHFRLISLHFYFVSLKYERKDTKSKHFFLILLFFALCIFIGGVDVVFFS